MRGTLVGLVLTGVLAESVAAVSGGSVESNPRAPLASAAALPADCGAPAADGAASPRRPLVPDDVYALANVSDPAISPDGLWIAHVVGRFDRDGDETRNTIWMVRWDGTECVQLTRPAKGIHAPRFSPDGRFLAFIASNAADGRDELRLLDRRGGEPRVATSAEDIETYAWSPDGSRLVVSMRGLERVASKPRPVVIDSLYFKQDEDGYLDASHRLSLYLVDVDSGATSALTPSGEANDTVPAWSPDGSHIAFARTRELGPDPDGREALVDIDISMLNAPMPRPARTASSSSVPAAPRAPAPLPPSSQLARVFAPNRQKLAWSADGRTIAFLTGQEPRFNQYIQDRLTLLRLGGKPRDLAPSLDRDVTSFAWLPDDAAVGATVADDGVARAVRIDAAASTPDASPAQRPTPVAGAASIGLAAPPSAGTPRPSASSPASEGSSASAPPASASSPTSSVTPLLADLSDPPRTLSFIGEAAGHIAALCSDDRTLVEVCAIDHGTLRRLTRHNDGSLARVQLGAVRDLRFKSRDGTAIHGFVVEPPGYGPGRHYPVMLWLHGGPNGQDAHELKAAGDSLLRQMLAARGYLVLGVNYRGSNGRGRSFQTAIAGDWGRLEAEDIEAGLAALLASGHGDARRIGVGGWSYGAILTDYLIAHDGRFGAAVAGAGTGNVTAMYGHDEYIVQYNHELGVPWENAQRWQALSSPLLHADRIRTPTLFMGGDRDFDVPLIGGEQLYEALRTLGVPTQLVVYPGEYHSIRRPSFVLDRITRIEGWLGRYLGS